MLIIVCTYILYMYRYPKLLIYWFQVLQSPPESRVAYRLLDMRQLGDQSVERLNVGTQLFVFYMGPSGLQVLPSGQRLVDVHIESLGIHHVGLLSGAVHDIP